MGKPFGPAQTEPHAITRSVSVRKSEIDIRNPRPLILENNSKSGPPVVLHDVELHGTTPAIVQRVTGQFTGGGDELRLIDQAEAQRDGLLPHGLAHDDDVLG